MKTFVKFTVTITFLFSSFFLFSQNPHHDFEFLFKSKSLAVFENDLGLTIKDLENNTLINYIEKQYSIFQTGVKNRLYNGVQISKSEFENEYILLLEKIKQKASELPFQSLSIPVSKLFNGPCVNMDFEQGNFNGWTLTRGDVDGSVPYSFVSEIPVGVTAYHQIFSGGLDPVTGISTVNPFGGNYSARLGNGAMQGARAARMTQTFFVDATNYIYEYSFAVIFETPSGHALNELPYFTVRVFDELGNNIPCGEYSVIADATTASTYSSIYNPSTLTYTLYKDWQTVFTNLNAYIGQNVTIEFTAGDCSLSGHYGYAYVDAKCGVSQITATNNLICSGDHSVLTAPLGATSYAWSTGQTTPSIIVVNAGNYSCSLIPVHGAECELVLDIDISESPSPLADFSPNMLVACVNEEIDFTDLSTIIAPGVISEYKWNFGDGTITPLSNGTIIAVPNTVGTYTSPRHRYTSSGVFNVELFVQSVDGCTDSFIIPITINPLPNVIAGLDQIVCEGNMITLNATGANNYTWNNNIVNGIPFSQSIGTITYTVIGTDLNGCQNTDQLEIEVSLPLVNAGLDQEVCEGELVTLSGSGAINYTWDNGIIDSNPFNQSIGTITYTVIGTDINGCQNTDQVNVTVNPLPIVDAGLDRELCESELITLSGNGALSYIWDNGIIDNTSFNQTIGTIIYTVIGIDVNGCQNTDQVEVIVNAGANVNAGQDQEVCEGTLITLSATGSSGYIWDNGVVNGVPFNSSLGTITYTVQGTDVNGCMNSDQVNVTVYPLPIVDAGLDQEICEGEMITLLGSGALSYIWDNGVIDNNPFIQSVGTITYTVIGNDINGCQNTDQAVVTVNPSIVVDAGLDQEVCEGELITLSGSGAMTYLWDNGVVNDSSFNQTIGTITYTVIGTDINDCQNADQVNVTVYPLPVVNAGNDIIICEGMSVTLFGSGTISYVWSNGVVNNVPFNQSVGTIAYTVTGTDINGCDNTDQVEVIVNPNPIVEAGINQEVCEGEWITLSGSGADTYIWDNGITNDVPFIQSPSTILYKLIGTDSNGCNDIDEVIVRVIALPNVDAGFDLVICEGTYITLSGSGADNYTWDNNIVNGIPFNQVVGTNTYTVIGTDIYGCENTDQMNVTVNPLPIIDAGLDQEFCEGTSIVLVGSGGISYIWNNGIIDGVPFIQNVGSVTYTVTGTDNNGCQNTDYLEVIINPNPIVNAGVDQFLCEDSWVTLIGSGAPTLIWSNSVMDSVTFQQQVGVSSYTLTGILPTGCYATDSVLVTVFQNPIITVNNIEICEGEEAILYANGAVSYIWTDGVSNGQPFFPSQSASYTVIGTDVNGCAAEAVSNVTVHPIPFVDFNILNSNVTTVIPLTGFQNLSTGAVNYEWNFNDGSPINTLFEPVHSFPENNVSNYNVELTGYSDFGCFATVIKSISVTRDFLIFVPNTFTPDHSGFNDLFKPVMTGFAKEDFVMYIFNRWGEIIFESHDMNIGWNGLIQNQRYQAQDGIYTWKIEAKIQDSSERKVFVGHVSVLR